MLHIAIDAMGGDAAIGFRACVHCGGR